ncbi:Subunit of the glycosylphosphatidylinositol transamidase complex-like protein, partial [Kickxella alabastrina]
RYNVDELHLAFTQGNWREARWGYPPVNSQGVGAEVRARIRGAEEQSAAQWKGLTNTLSGVFCASLNFIDETNTVMPQLTFADESASSSMKEGILRQGYLPRENVCTENLTPWIKQLPCQSKSGVGALLNPHRLYNMHFNSMGISLEPVGRTRHGGRPTALRYKQHLSVVLDPRTFGLGSKWTASELVGMQLVPACPVAERSTVRVVIAPGSGVRVTPAASALGKLAGLDMHTFDLKSQRSMGEIEVEFDSMGANESPLPALGVHRHVTGHGGSSGGVEAVIVNRGDKAVDVTYLDTLPWYLRVYSHTLEIRTQRGGEGAAGAGAVAVAERLVPSRLLFSPAVDRGRPSTMELALRLGPQSRTTLRYSFDKGFLKYTEHPPDANRGFNIGPAIVSYTSDAGGGSVVRLYWEISATVGTGVIPSPVGAGGGGGGGGCVVRAYS